MQTESLATYACPVLMLPVLERLDGRIFASQPLRDKVATDFSGETRVIPGRLPASGRHAFACWLCHRLSGGSGFPGAQRPFDRASYLPAGGGNRAGIGGIWMRH